MADSLPGISQLNGDLADRVRQDRFDTLVLFDIDHFLQVNARHGTGAGDRILAIVERVLTEHAQRAYRIGGDQYAALDLSRARVEEFRACFRAAVAQQVQAQVSLSGGGVQVGSQFLVASDETARILYGAASHMLALAKQGGRDAVVWLAEPESGRPEVGEAAQALYRDLARVNAARARRMEVESRVDALTGLFNRRGFDAIFARLVETAQRAERSLALIYMDSDTLKRINDARGHDAGDRFIVDLASVIRSIARRSDFVFRWGADEFAVVLESGDIDRAEALAQRLRTAIAERTGGTVSIGIYCGVPSSAEEAVRVADAAMYAAKEAGKDRVVIGDRQRRERDPPGPP